MSKKLKKEMAKPKKATITYYVSIESGKDNAVNNKFFSDREKAANLAAYLNKVHGPGKYKVFKIIEFN